jgi:hypothetical protein
MVETKAALANDVQHQQFIKELRPMLRYRTNEVILEFAHWYVCVTKGSVHPTINCQQSTASTRCAHTN